MERDLQEEPVEYGVSLPSTELTQPAASIGTCQMALEYVSNMCFFCKITYTQYSSYRNG